jgi:glutathione S-transferase
VPFIERELQGRQFEHLQPAYLRINPRGQVPALVHDGRVYTEGMTINEYIDEAFAGPPLRPADPVERWRMRVWCRYAENDLGRCLMMINWNRIMPVFIGARDMQEVDDIDFMNFCGMLLVMWMGDLVNEQSTPAFMDWVRRVNQRPAVQEVSKRRTGMPSPPAGAAR